MLVTKPLPVLETVTRIEGDGGERGMEGDGGRWREMEGERGVEGDGGRWMEMEGGREGEREGGREDAAWAHLSNETIIRTPAIASYSPYCSNETQVETWTSLARVRAFLSLTLYTRAQKGFSY